MWWSLCSRHTQQNAIVSIFFPQKKIECLNNRTRSLYIKSMATRKIVVLIDGISSRGALGYCPRMLEFFQRPFSLGSMAVTPQRCSITHVNMTSVLSGTDASEHGVWKNDGLGEKVVTRRLIKKIFQRHPELIVVGRVDKDRYRGGATSPKDGMTDFFERYAGWTHKKAVDTPAIAFKKALKSNKDVVVYVSRPDDVGHEHGWDSTQYYQALRQVDKDMAILFSSKQKGTVVMVAGDHGGLDLKDSSRKTIGGDHTSRECAYSDSLSEKHTDPRLQTVAFAGRLDHKFLKLPVDIKKTGELTKYLWGIDY
jgi:Type I phosphodiesterase / nucleotide pyrophosphatase